MSASYGSVPPPNDNHLGRGYGSGATDFATNNPTMTSPLSQSAGANHHEDFDASYRGSVYGDGGLQRAASSASTAVSRNNTLKKRSSVRRTGSLRRSSSKKSLKAGSIRGFGGEDDGNYHSVFFTPVPTSGSPTEILANRFQAWRTLLKALITYFREVQSSYEVRAKALHKVQNTVANIVHPSVFMSDGGLGDASRLLDAYHKRAIAEAAKSRDIEEDVIGALTGLRSDLGQKIKEIKSLSADFKNSVEKEKEATRRELEKLQDALHNADVIADGKHDPYVVRLGVDRAIEKQIDEENYLHRAYLNLESSGRELESIVVGEIQKAYNALAGILRREGDDAYQAVEALRSGPIAMPKDQEWYQFVTSDESFVDPSMPLRRVEDIEYPGKHHPAATEIRAGMLERKTKYLKSYSAGWYVLSPTHLHEFKSADKLYTQPPVMSLALADHRLGSHSEPGSSSHKFMLKGAKAAGKSSHNWVFRAESHETMLAWFDDIRSLTEKSAEERSAFVRQHARSVSGGALGGANSDRATISSDGLEEDEADRTPYSGAGAVDPLTPNLAHRPARPQPGGRFPSDLALRTMGEPTTLAATGAAAGATAAVIAHDDDDDAATDRDLIAAAGAVPGSAQHGYSADENPYRLSGVDAGAALVTPTQVSPLEEAERKQEAVPAAPAATSQAAAIPSTTTWAAPSTAAATTPATSAPAPAPAPHAADPEPAIAAPVAAAALGGAGLGAGAATALKTDHQPQQKNLEDEADAATPIAASRSSAAPASAAAPHTVSPVVAAAVAPAAASTTTAPSTQPAPARTTTAPHVPTAEIEDTSDLATLTAGLTGHERAGAHVTGAFFPAVVRHDTDISVSKLHVPGEFPKRGEV